MLKLLQGPEDVHVCCPILAACLWAVVFKTRLPFPRQIYEMGKFMYVHEFSTIIAGLRSHDNRKCEACPHPKGPGSQI